MRSVEVCRLLSKMVVGLFAVGVSFPIASAPANFGEAVRDTRPSMEIRYRLETVDQEGIARNATASTAKARLSWIMPSANGFTVGIEGDYVFVFPPGSGENYNSTENGRTAYPVVADPTDFDLNQAFLRYGRDRLTVTAGRQRIAHFEQRLVGAAVWRQNDQTYDAVRVQTTNDKFSLDYSYVINVNRIFGPGDGAQPGDWKGDSHLIRSTLNLAENHSVGAFAYLLDFENDNGPVNSTATYGVDYKGAFGPLSLVGSIAQQQNWARSPLSYETMYYMIEARVKSGSMTFTAGYEVLDSDGGEFGFRTPLGSLHKFQGWTDKFTATPPTGVEDAYVTVVTRVGPAALTLAYHRFQAEQGGSDYGDEIGAMVTWPIVKNLSALLKIAQYDAKDHASDTTKFWLMLTYRF